MTRRLASSALLLALVLGASTTARSASPPDQGKDAARAVRSAREVRSGLAGDAPLYLHLDLDVLDPADGRANPYAAPGGVRAASLIAFCEALGTPTALTVSAYDPACDGDGRVRDAAFAAIDALVASRGA